MKVTVYTPPNQDALLPVSQYNSKSVFLAGSIEMGTAYNWQEEVTSMLAQHAEAVDTNITIYNPRRADWDSSWVQDKDNPQFREQVEWELAALDQADLIIMFLVAGTISPISLLELGLFKDRNLVVYCAEGFARRGNVEIVCERFDIPCYSNSVDFSRAVKFALEDKNCMPFKTNLPPVKPTEVV